MFQKKYKANYLLLCLCIFACSLFSINLFSYSQVNAQAQRTDAQIIAGALRECEIRVKKENCIRQVKACGNDKPVCAVNRSNNVGISGTKVMTECRQVQNPQRCHSEVTAKCGSQPRATQPICKQETIRNLFPENPAPGGGAGGAGGAAGGAEDLGIPDALLKPQGADKEYFCGKVDKINTRFDLGCLASSKDASVAASAPNSGIVDLAYAAVRFLIQGIGLVIVAAIIYAGIMYASSGGNAEETQKAKGKILNAMIALIFYFLITAIGQFLIPGGIFRT